MGITKLADLPAWADPVLQGLAFWVGYQRELYRHHRLPEGAIVAELSGLLMRNLGPGDRLYREVPASIIGPSTLGRTTGETTKKRIDLVIAPATTKGLKAKEALANDAAKAQVAIEVKRAVGEKGAGEDLRRLANLSSPSSGLRRFLIVVSQRAFPKSFATEKKKAKPGRREIPGGPSGWRYKVRRVCRAESVIDAKHRRGVYVCLIEVVADG